MTFPTWLILGFCSGFVTGDDEMSMYICECQYEAKYRPVESVSIPTLMWAREASKLLYRFPTFPDWPFRPRPTMGKEGGRFYKGEM